MQSWSYWQFKLFNDITTAGPEESFYNGTDLSVPKVKALSRSYAQAIQGLPLLMDFNAETSEFQLIYNLDTTIQGPTVIFLNEKWYYPNGYQVRLSPSGLATWSKISTNYIQVVGAKSGKLTVDITAN